MPNTTEISDAERLEAIKLFVREERKRRNLTIFYRGGSPELSCFANGEYSNLLWRKLLQMREEDWLVFGQLNCPEILKGVYRETLP